MSKATIEVLEFFAPGEIVVALLFFGKIAQRVLLAVREMPRVEVALCQLDDIAMRPLSVSTTIR